ncbi:MAG: SRPBCC domain-containing protein, partial [Gammaproteobacteria bacterium]|nr:SRPBCC domain-containing protein [Gammaproteobacteria bacterium]
MTSNNDTTVFEIVRFIRQPLARVWKAWSEAEQLQHWWGPKGCTLEVGRFEFRPGGFCHYAMKFPEAPVMWGRFNYREIEAPRRLVWLNSFANEHCGI